MITARLKCILLAGAALPLALTAAPALAHKPSTHIYLSEEAIRDMLDDGKVTIYRVDYETGEILGELGRFDVDPKVLAAVRTAPQQFRAGVIGPDGYPDIITGQQIIHPDEAVTSDGSADGSNAWLTHIWKTGFLENGDARVNAFAVGYLTHAAGDVFAHTYVNHFTGGEFALTPVPTNGIKHIVLEGYIGRRTPVAMNVFPRVVTVGRVCNGRKADDLGYNSNECGTEQKRVIVPVSFNDVSIDGVDDFIHDQMVYAAPGSLLEQQLLIGSNTNKSVPAIFSALRNGLAADVEKYDRERMELTGPARLTYSSFHGPKAEYKRSWIADIDEGLAAWPAVSHELATSLVFTNPGPTDMSKAMDAIGTYQSDHLISMMGVPDALIATSQFIGEIISAILPPPLREGLAELKKDAAKSIIGIATGRSAEEWNQYLSNPETKFDEVMNRPGGENNGGTVHQITLEAFNRDELKIEDAGFSNRELKFKVETFAPAFNTLQLTKMTFLGAEGTRQLAASLEAAGAPMAAVPANHQNIMLGWVASLDAGNQTHSSSASARPLFGGNSDLAYRNLFMKMTGEPSAEHGSSPVPSGTQPEAPLPPPPVEVPIDDSLPPPGGESSGSLPPGSGAPGSGGWGTPNLPSANQLQSIERFSVGLVRSSVLRNGVVDIVLSIQNDTRDNQPIVGSLFHLNLVDVDGLGAATVAPFVAEEGPARTFAERVTLYPRQQMEVRFQIQPHPGHGPLDKLTVRVGVEDPAVFDMSALMTPLMSPAAAAPTGDSVFASLTNFDVRVDRILDQPSGGSEVYYTIRNATDRVQRTTGTTVSFSFVDPSGSVQKSMRNFFPSRGTEKPRLLNESVFIEPGAEAHMRTYFASRAQGQIHVTDDRVTETVFNCSAVGKCH